MNPDKFALKYTRMATLRDVQQIVDLSCQLAAATGGYSDIPADPVKLTRTVEQFIVEQPHDMLMLVSVDDEDKIVGFIACIPFKLIYADEDIGIEVGWYVDPKANDHNKRHIELRAGYEEWCRRKGMRYAQYAVLNPTEEDIKEVRKNSKSRILELVYHRKLN